MHYVEVDRNSHNFLYRLDSSRDLHSRIRLRMSVSDIVLYNRIKKDDVSWLSSMIGWKMQADHRFSRFFSCRQAMLRNSPPLISVAAFCKAAQCFRYLVSNGADLTATDSLNVSLATFAVAGGSMEILSLLNELGVSFEGTLFTAAERGNFQVFTWVLATQLEDVTKRKTDKKTLLHYAAKSGNCELICFVSDVMKDSLEVKDIYDVMFELENQMSDSSEDNDTNSYGLNVEPIALDLADVSMKE